MRTTTALNTKVENRNMTDYVPYIEALLDSYTPGKDGVGEIIHYTTDSGTCVGVGLFKDATYAVQIVTMSEGSAFQLHKHEEHETLTIVDGRLHIVYGGRVITLDVGESHTIRPGVKHKVYTVGPAVVLAVTVPGAAGFPDGPK